MNKIFRSIKNNISNDFFVIYNKLYNTNNLYNHNKIIRNLYLGNYESAKNKLFILNEKIDLVINCSHDLDIPNFYEENNIKVLRLPIDDSISEIDQKIMQINLPKLVKVISYFLKSNKKVYVHCFAGMQRSATVVICYLIYKNFIEKKRIAPLSHYYYFLKKKRNIVFMPRPTFENIISQFYDKIKSSKI